MRTPWIENIAAIDVSTGYHFDAGENSMLISIADPRGWRPAAKCEFKERHDFTFLDAEDSDGFPESEKISDEQAKQLADLLKHALENNMNVIVHCVAGMCRSGAVAEVGIMMGFADTGKFRQPNLRVKKKMIDALSNTTGESDV